MEKDTRLAIATSRPWRGRDAGGGGFNDWKTKKEGEVLGMAQIRELKRIIAASGKGASKKATITNYGVNIYGMHGMFRQWDTAIDINSSDKGSEALSDLFHPRCSTLSKLNPKRGELVRAARAIASYQLKRGSQMHHCHRTRIFSLQLSKLHAYHDVSFSKTHEAQGRQVGSQRPSGFSDALT
jgi:hypothetical protein